MFDFIEGMIRNNECAGCLVGNTLAEFGQENERISRALQEAMAAKEDMLVGAFQAAIDSGELTTPHSAKALSRGDDGHQSGNGPDVQIRTQ